MQHAIYGGKGEIKDNRVAYMLLKQSRMYASKLAVHTAGVESGSITKQLIALANRAPCGLFEEQLVNFLHLAGQHSFLFDQLVRVPSVHSGTCDRVHGQNKFFFDQLVRVPSEVALFIVGTLR